ncbi:DNA-binding NarL/FixJ family response regulator [Mycobacterium sp. MAA66]|uniref:response regulator transcription factor n=1 Tax=Mycobacterium sp. MAA66 TaxID=3156297 RepID=UPI0035195DF2
MISVVVADDQAAVREGLTTILSLTDGIEVVGAAADGTEAEQMVQAHRPDVLLLDLHMPIRGGLDVLPELVVRFPSTKVLVLTTYSDETSISEALAAGAHGYITKSDGAAQIIAAITAVAAGHGAFGREVTTQLVGALTNRARLDRVARHYGLTEQETRVLKLIGTGLRNREIAAELFVSVATIKTHINNMFTKLGVQSRQQALELVAEKSR